MTQDRPTPDDIDELIEYINENTQWDVEDYYYEEGMYDPPQLTINAEWTPEVELVTSDTPPSDKEIVLDVVDELEAEYPEGAPIDQVRGTVANRGHALTRDEVDDIIEKTRRKGEIYEPREGHLRGT